jgi:tetratricopeptide (TPR) repeat protein
MKGIRNVSIIIYAVWIAFIAAVFSFADADEVGAKNRKANKLYDKGRYEEALKLYGDALLLDPSNGKLKMNGGSALYRMGELEEAEKSYREAAASLSAKKALADAHYNLGNVQYAQGEKLEAAGNAASARKSYTGAMENYVNTLKLRPGDKDAKWNLQMAHRKIDMLKDTRDKERNQDDKDAQNNENQQDGKNGQDNKDGQNNEEEDDKEQQGKDEQQDKDDRGKDDERRQRQDGGEDNQRKEEAERMIEQYADDSDTLNKPRFQRVRVRQPEKDW